MDSHDVVKPFKQPSSAAVVNLIADEVAKRLSVEHLRSVVSVTFGELFDRWMRDYATPHMQPKTRQNYERMFRCYFMQWKDAQVYAIKRSDVAAWQSRLAENIGATTANRARELMRMVFNKAIEWELIPDNYNPATKLRKFALQSRDRFLQADELPRFFAALPTLRYDAARDCILMCLLTAQRVGNVKTMRWDQIDLNRAVWTIPRTKNGSPHVVPLVPWALEVLRRRKDKSASAWVFPSPFKDAPISKLEKAWQELLRKAGIDNLRIHDLRRSHASWQAIAGVNVSNIAYTLNHRDLTATSIYARLNVDAPRVAMMSGINAMLVAAGMDCMTPAREHQDQSTSDSVVRGWVDESEASRIAGVSKESLCMLRHQNSGPAYMKEGFSIRYDADTVRRWFANRKHERH